MASEIRFLAAALMVRRLGDCPAARAERLFPARGAAVPARAALSAWLRFIAAEIFRRASALIVLRFRGCSDMVADTLIPAPSGTPLAVSSAISRSMPALSASSPLIANSNNRLLLFITLLRQV